MSVLDNIPATQAVERTKGYDPVRIRRRKLATALQDQLNLLNATEAGSGYRKVQVERKRDLETDEMFDIERQRRVTPWWWVDDDGSLKFSLRYGSAQLRVKDGKEVLVLSTVEQLRALIPALRQEVLAGVFDEALAAAANDLQHRFKTKKRAPG